MRGRALALLRAPARRRLPGWAALRVAGRQGRLPVGYGRAVLAGWLAGLNMGRGPAWHQALQPGIKHYSLASSIPAWPGLTWGPPQPGIRHPQRYSCMASAKVLLHGTPWYSCMALHGTPAWHSMVLLHGTPWCSCMALHGTPAWHSMVLLHGTPWYSCMAAMLRVCQETEGPHALTLLLPWLPTFLFPHG